MKTFLQKHEKFVYLFISLVSLLFSILIFLCNINLIVDGYTFKLGLSVGLLFGNVLYQFLFFIDSKRKSSPSGEDKLIL